MTSQVDIEDGLLDARPKRLRQYVSNLDWQEWKYQIYDVLHPVVQWKSAISTLIWGVLLIPFLSFGALWVMVYFDLVSLMEYDEDDYDIDDEYAEIPTVEEDRMHFKCFVGTASCLGLVVGILMLASFIRIHCIQMSVETRLLETIEVLEESLNQNSEDLRVDIRFVDVLDKEEGERRGSAILNCLRQTFLAWNYTDCVLFVSKKQLKQLSAVSEEGSMSVTEEEVEDIYKILSDS